jgi:cyanophycin synthetase
VVVPSGFAVLNALDPIVLEMAQHCLGKVVLFGASREQSPIKEHVDAGGAALVRLGSQLQWWAGGGKDPEPLLVSQLTESTDASSVEPLMAAAAAALALGVSRSAIEVFLSKSGY